MWLPHAAGQAGAAVRAGQGSCEGRQGQLSGQGALADTPIWPTSQGNGWMENSHRQAHGMPCKTVTNQIFSPVTGFLCGPSKAGTCLATSKVPPDTRTNNRWLRP